MAINIPITIEEHEKIINFLNEISFFLKAIMNAFTIKKTVINMMIAEKILVKMISMVNSLYL